MQEHAQLHNDLVGSESPKSPESNHSPAEKQQTEPTEAVEENSNCRQTLELSGEQRRAIERTLLHEHADLLQDKEGTVSKRVVRSCAQTMMGHSEWVRAVALVGHQIVTAGND